MISGRDHQKIHEPSSEVKKRRIGLPEPLAQ
jgi:hypothetical protein